jgi:regulator of protease activity HflC (stomatin/prohibitin superfamily)
MGVTQEVVNSGLGLPKAVIAGVPTLAIVGGSAFKAAVMVPKNHVGVRTRFKNPERTKDQRFGDGRVGDIRGIERAGLHWKIPLTDSIELVSLQDRSHDLPPQQADSKDRKQLLIISAIKWGVSIAAEEHPVNALFNVYDGDRTNEDGTKEDMLTRVVVRGSASAVRDVVTGSNSDIFKRDAGAIFEEVKERCESKLLSRHGVELRGLDLVTTTRSLGEMIKEAGGMQNISLLGGLAAVAAGGDLSRVEFNMDEATEEADNNGVVTALRATSGLAER